MYCSITQHEWTKLEAGGTPCLAVQPAATCSAVHTLEHCTAGMDASKNSVSIYQSTCVWSHAMRSCAGRRATCLQERNTSDTLGARSRQMHEYLIRSQTKGHRILCLLLLLEWWREKECRRLQFRSQISIRNEIRLRIIQSCSYNGECSPVFRKKNKTVPFILRSHRNRSQ